MEEERVRPTGRSQSSSRNLHAKIEAGKLGKIIAV